MHPTRKISIFRFQIPNTLKLDLLLVQYLYIHKQLELPGIGRFTLEETLYPEADMARNEKLINPQSLSFTSDTTIKNNPGLIEFISSQTGKIKALAAADLDSHLSLAQQFLNIGNPFLFEGIGSLVKIKSGEYILASVAGMPEKMKDYSSREISATTTSGESFTGYKSILYKAKEKLSWRKPVVILLVLAGIAFAIWGGYTMYKLTSAKNKSSAEPENKNQEPLPEKDSVLYQKDSIAETVQLNPVQSLPTGNYKYILETAKAVRAFERFSRLKTFQWNVQMETKDSVTYKLFLILPSSVADTSRIIDSLSRVNGRRVFIEK